MTVLMTDEEFIGKIEWEGGIIGALEYGLKAEMLADKTTELWDEWSTLEKEWAAFMVKVAVVEALIPEDAW